MQVLQTNGIATHWREDGDASGVPVVFANSLGTDLRLWDAVLPLLPAGFRYIRYDMRGHGLTTCPPAPYDMDTLTADAEALIEGLGLGPVIFEGLSIGGMIGQALAAKRPDLIRALVLSNTAARMGDTAMWEDRIAQIDAGGIAALSGAVLDRWFGPAFRHTPAVSPWEAMLTRTPKSGYLGCCAAIAGCDLTPGTSALRLPALGIAGEADGASPPALVAATCDLIPGSRFHIIPGAGHLPCVEAPQSYAEILTPFLKENAHV